MNCPVLIAPKTLSSSIPRIDLKAPVAGTHVIIEHAAYIFVHSKLRTPAQHCGFERVGADVLEILTAETLSEKDTP